MEGMLWVLDGPGETGEKPGKDYSGWPLRDRLELLAFDARLAGVPPALLEALWGRLTGYLTLRCRSPSHPAALQRLRWPDCAWP